LVDPSNPPAALEIGYGAMKTRSPRSG